MKYSIRALYYTSGDTEVELPEGKTWEDVDTWYVKWHTLHYWFKDDPDKVYKVELDDLGVDNTDYKYPAGVEILSEDLQEEVDSQG